MKPSIHRSAVISPDQLYRNQLARSWTNDFGAWALWLGLNPSTADGESDDPTIDNVCRRTQFWERSPQGKPFVGVFMGNLYAWRSTDPQNLLERDLDIVGPENDVHLRYMIERSDMVICAWGNGPFGVRRSEAHIARCRAVVKFIQQAGRQPYMLNLCKSGHPRHPLYWPDDALAKPFDGYDGAPPTGLGQRKDGNEGTAPEVPGEDPR